MKYVLIGMVVLSMARLSLAIDRDLTPIEIPNPGFEQVGDDNLPAQWEKRFVGIPAQVASDSDEKHSGQRSVRMEAGEMARTNVLSAPFPVAPGEVIHAGAWVKCKGVPPDQGKIMMVGQWTDAEGKGEQASRIEIADVTKPDWQHIEGKITVPPGAALMRIRLGFVYSHGTIWWDDVTVSAERPLVARLGLSGTRLSPATSGVPITIINRDGRTGAARMRVDLAPEAKAKGSSQGGADAPVIDITLAGALEQRIDVPLEIHRRGKLKLSAALLPAEGDEPIFSDARAVTVPSPIMLMPPSPTHWAVEDGPARLSGEVELALSPRELQGATLKAQLVDSSGQSRAEWHSDPAHAPKDFVNTFTFDAGDLPQGDYTLVATLTPGGGGEAVHAEQPFGVVPRKLAKVTLNADGFPVYNGKAIFPIGIFNGGAKVKEMGEVGFTVQHAYNAVNVAAGERPNDQAAFEFLNSAEKNGLKCLFLIPRGEVFAGNFDAFRRRVRMFRNHPGLLAWDEEEGIARGDMPLDSLVKLRKIIEEEDPNHPLMVGDPRDVISRMDDRSNFFPVDLMDLGMWWWYPFPLEKGKDSGLEGEERSKENELTPPSFLTQARTDKPLWVGVQAYKKPQEYGRYPTPIEYRAQAYMSVIHGGKGIMYYGGSVTGGMYLHPEEAHWNDVKKLVRELHEMSPVFMSKTIEMPKFEPADAKLSVMLKQTDDGRLVLLTCNRAATPVKATFSLPHNAGSTATVLYEDRTVRIDGGKLADNFEPYQVHVYDLTAR